MVTGDGRGSVLEECSKRVWDSIWDVMLKADCVFDEPVVGWSLRNGVQKVCPAHCPQFTEKIWFDLSGESILKVYFGTRLFVGREW